MVGFLQYFTSDHLLKLIKIWPLLIVKSCVSFIYGATFLSFFYLFEQEKQLKNSSINKIMSTELRNLSKGKLVVTWGWIILCMIRLT